MSEKDDKTAVRGLAPEFGFTVEPSATEGRVRLISRATGRAERNPARGDGVPTFTWSEARRYLTGLRLVRELG